MGHDHAPVTITTLPLPETDTTGLDFDEYLMARGLAPKTVGEYVRAWR